LPGCVRFCPSLDPGDQLLSACFWTFVTFACTIPARMTAEGFFSRNGPALLMAGSALAWYVASLVLCEAMSGGAIAPRRRAFGHWIPIAFCAVIAVLSRQPEIAVGVLFATSVAAVSLVLGMVLATLETPSSRAGGFAVIETNPTVTPAAVAPPLPGNRTWVFVLPVALLVLLAGFSGEVRTGHAIVLLLQGLVIAVLWPDAPADQARQASLAPVRSGRRLATEIVLALALAALGGWGGVRATRDISDSLGLGSRLPLTAWLAAPALVLPMIGAGMMLARRAAFSAVASTSVGVVVLNLCVALPLIAVIWKVQPALPGMIGAALPLPKMTSTAPATSPATAPAAAMVESAPLYFPLSVWRVDTVMLVVLGLYLLPTAFGRWLPSRGDGAALIIAYMAYMWLTAWVTRG